MQTETDIAALFAKDPLKHSEQDIDAIIAKMRDQRHTFNSVKTKAPTSAGAKPKAAKPGAIDLGDLTL